MPKDNQNITMFQFFEWYTPADHKHWIRLKEQAPILDSLGLSAIWIPPPFKGMSKQDVGYAPYDLWDFGEFDQKGQVPTKYGTKAELQAAIDECHRLGMHVYLDAVLNHKGAADAKETFMAVAVDNNDRMVEIEEPREITAWTKFTFPGRKDKYSDFKWHWFHFSGVDWDDAAKRKAVFKIKGEFKDFAQDVDNENGNFDYLMLSDIDYGHPEVVAETEKWARWVVQDEFGFDGFRIDALKHVSFGFITHLLQYIRNDLQQPEFFCVGEYWKEDLDGIETQPKDGNGHIHLFDVPLHFNFMRAGQQGAKFDMRSIFDNTLVQKCPASAVTFIDNHDTQPYQGLQSWVEPWFKPLAAAIICLRFDGFPCIFYGDFYGIEAKSKDEPHTAIPACQAMLSRILLARKEFAYGPQHDYFDHPNCVGWVRDGDEHHPQGLAVVVSNSDSAGSKWMKAPTGGAGAGAGAGADNNNKNTVWTDMMGYWKDPVTVNNDGWAEFKCHPGSVSIWVPKVKGKHWITVQESGHVAAVGGESSSSPVKNDEHEKEKHQEEDHHQHCHDNNNTSNSRSRSSSVGGDSNSSSSSSIKSGISSSTSVSSLPSSIENPDIHPELPQPLEHGWDHLLEDD
ncbi:hypothetical protein DFQ27_007675 [Actinomortierella ambigua]|uniref:Glycosyl hydrolase family 13 catalytic domain-containing protein n=1 Tax=Actinomortierella ambigua TaxID=1343610 RepID=A0A9P6QIN2_9FUNG|nr:hypothetical protein DFQ27_007675 [Actinomortierella ambigua]